MRRLRPTLLTLGMCLALAACADAGGGPAETHRGSVSPTSTAPATDAPDPRVAELEQTIATRINAIRREHRLQPLEARRDLAQVARDYSQEMLREGFFSHVAPDGDSVADRVRQAGISFTAVGENLFKSVGPVDHAQVAVQGWMDSEGHRENILRDVFSQTGVGVAMDGQTVYVTQVFSRP